jgi:uncharacterized protein (TIGR00725 family)
VIGPRDATTPQLTAAIEVGELLGDCRITVICGGRGGVMQAVCEGVARVGGLSVGLLPETDAAVANRFVGVPIATGIGEARNALIARAAFCLIAIGDSFGTLSEVALGRQFGKLVIGLEGAADLEGGRRCKWQPKRSLRSTDAEQRCEPHFSPLLGGVSLSVRGSAPDCGDRGGGAKTGPPR